MTAEEYWSGYKEKTGDTTETYNAYYFCNNESDASELAQLVAEGKKCATASNAWIYEHENEPLPKCGDISVITDFYGEPKCIVKTTRVDIVRFSGVTAEFAAAEGEGDLSLEFWRDVHSRIFSKECESIGRTFSEDMPVVCEHFCVIYK